ncbi:hypothetical protein BC828DRAFT_292042 [Blastocladiella britannica]|nr:hypothetical protein BC828DRAFT_292042 [Blastocladiella britannica]
MVFCKICNFPAVSAHNFLVLSPGIDLSFLQVPPIFTMPPKFDPSDVKYSPYTVYFVFTSCWTRPRPL